MTATSGAPSVRSEVGRLRSVLLHRPGVELGRVTPGTMDELLFDELLWVEEAQREHDAFAEVLRGAGVEVRYVEELLAEVVADPAIAEALVARHVTETSCGPQAVDRVRALLLDCSPIELVEHLIAGVTLEEVGPLDGLVAAASAPTELVLAPLPNLVFTRDSSAWIGEGVVLSPMNRMVRRRESDLLRTVYREHPDLAGAPDLVRRRTAGPPPRDLRGRRPAGRRRTGPGDRDVRAHDPRRASRRSPRGLFAADVVDRILAVDLPKVRAAMHLDTVVTQVDVDAFVTYPAMTGSVRCFLVTPGPGRLGARRRRRRAGAGARLGRRARPRPGHRTRARVDPGRTRAVERRQQHPGASRPARSSPTPATRPPTRSSPTRASPCTRSPPPSSRVAAGGRGACPVPCVATPSEPSRRRR